MAASSSSSGCRNYDVFLSFRGEDTRKIFVGHLYRALKQKTIQTFFDSEDLRKGNTISKALTAIDDSRLSIVVLSENYASSTWCLKELVKILECMDTDNQIVVPIFYQVDPSHIRKLKGTFAQAFAKHEDDSYANKEEVQVWKTALTRAADLSGWDSRDYKDDGDLIEEIVEDIFNKLVHISSSKAIGLVGIDYHLNQMYSLLSLEVDDVRFVGIWGMGGIGKTTIARAVYDKIAHQFDHYRFLDNVKEGFTKNGEAQMKEELLSRILKEKGRSTGILNRASNMIMEKLGKVLLVLDDVDDIAQTEILLGNQPPFRGGSRIIITTRDRQSLSGVDYRIYEPNCLNYYEAYELFMKYAFKTNNPSKEYDHLSAQAIGYAQGLPLALKVLGAFLHNKSIQEWEDALEKIKNIPHRKIQDVLRTSFDGLDDSEKNIFLDVACFFRGMQREYASRILDICGFFPRSGLRVLIDRALITISQNDRLEMHDLIQEMGREIGRFSRLGSYEHLERVLTENTDTKAVEAIIIDLSNTKDVYLNSEAFFSMTKLRLLKILSYGSCEQCVDGDIKFLSPELRFLVWHGSPLKSLPSNFNPKNLVELDMRRSHIDQLWEGTKPLEKLIFVNLSHCRYLKSTPDFTKAKNLKRLQFEGCISLVEVHPSISTLESLIFLSLKECTKVEKFPQIVEGMGGLRELHLDGTSLKELYPSIEWLKRLELLNMRDCKSLARLPDSICHLACLRSLYLTGCSKLYNMPEDLGNLESLRKLEVQGSGIKQFPFSILRLINQLERFPCDGWVMMPPFSSWSSLVRYYGYSSLLYLDVFYCKELKSLPSSIYMKSLKTLVLTGCSNLEKLPEASGIVKALQGLYLAGTSIKEMPASIKNLTGLVTLGLRGCKELQRLPSSICQLKSLAYITLSDCSKFVVFPEIVEDMEELRELHLDGTSIKELSPSIERLTSLVLLNMRNCRTLVSLPENICNLSHLKSLYLSGCSNLSNLPEGLWNLKSLQELEVHGSGIKHFQLSISPLNKQLVTFSFDGCKEMIAAPLPSWSSLVRYYGFFGLLHLDISDCNLFELSDEFPHLSSLHTLKLSRNNFESLPAALNQLYRLRVLNLEGCKRLKSIPELSSCINDIDAYDCTALKTVSTLKPPYQGNICFTFFNCLQLVRTNLFRDIVEMYHSHRQGNLQALDFRMCLPGSKIPDWFSHQCAGPSVTVQLPLENKILGFAICGLSNFKCPQYASDVSATCFCNFKGHDGNYSFSFNLRDWSVSVLQLDRSFKSKRFLRSDHIFMGYVPWPKSIIEQGKAEGGGREKAEEEIQINEGYYTEATFTIVLQIRGYTYGFRVPVETCSITSSGVRFFCEEEVKNLSIKRSREVCCNDEAELSEEITKRRNLFECPF